MPEQAPTTLEHRLAQLAGELKFPETPDIAAAVADRLRGEPKAPVRRRLALPARRAVAIAVVSSLAGAATAFAASSGLRDLVLDALGVRVERALELPSVPPGAGPALGERVELAEAERRAGFRLLGISRRPLQTPDRVHVREVDGTSIVSFSFRPRPSLPASPHTGTGLLLAQFRARVDRPLLGKTFADTRVVPVRVRGEAGYWLAGAKHVVGYRSERGAFELAPRLAGNVLVWQRGPIALRLEGEISKARALGLARAVR